MIVLDMANTTFSKWLIEQVEGRGWSYAELARRADLSGATISLVVNEQKNPGTDFCAGVARALDLPPETVFRRAGLLPPEPDLTSRAKIAMHLFRSLPLHEQESLIVQMRALAERATTGQRRTNVATEEATVKLA